MGLGSDDSGIKKLVQKLHHPHKEKDGGEHSNEDSEDRIHLPTPGHKHPRHKVTEGYVESALHGGVQEVVNAMSQDEVLAVISNLVRAQAVVGTGAAIREGLNVLGDDQGMEVVGKLVAAQAVLFAKTSMDPLAREATREGAKEAVTGSYDAVERKMVDLFSRNKSTLRLVGPAMSVGALMFMVPLLLCMWRFALFGLGPVR